MTIRLTILKTLKDYGPRTAVGLLPLHQAVTGIDSKRQSKHLTNMRVAGDIERDPETSTWNITTQGLGKLNAAGDPITTPTPENTEPYGRPLSDAEARLMHIFANHAPMNFAELSETIEQHGLDIDHQSLQKIIKILSTAGLIERDYNHRLAITEDGEQWVNNHAEPVTDTSPAAATQQPAPNAVHHQEDSDTRPEILVTQQGIEALNKPAAIPEGPAAKNAHMPDTETLGKLAQIQSLAQEHIDTIALATSMKNAAKNSLLVGALIEIRNTASSLMQDSNPC